MDWKTSSGTFRVYTQCLGPIADKPGYIGRNATVGPGYVAQVWDAKGRVIVDDTAVAPELGPNSGSTGLGQFGFHLARVPQDASAPFVAGTASDERVFQIAGRWCNANRHDDGYGGYNGWGVRDSRVVDGPRLDASGIGRLVMDVTLGDAYSDLVSLRYTYAVGGHDVKAWITVTTLCDDGKCGGAAARGDAFVKEPKVVVGVNPANPDDVGYARMTIFDAHGDVAMSSTSNSWANATCGSSPETPDAHCEWGGANPQAKTGQCDGDDRTRVRFWSGTTACKDDPACLVVAAGSADEAGATFQPWEGSPKSLDAWAIKNVSEKRDRAAPSDSPSGGLQWTCDGDSAARTERRWELAGYAKTPACHHTTELASFHAWEGGTGIFDCENLYYRFGKSEQYVVALAFGFNGVALP